MAVVFISPRQRQKTFFIVITLAFAALVGLVALWVFLAKPAQNSSILVFNKPKVVIDLNVFDSDQFKELVPISPMQIQFSYTATTSKKKVVSGTISAASLADAQKILKTMGLTPSTVKPVEIGRNNPFSPYYQTIITPPVITPPTTNTNTNTITQ